MAILSFALVNLCVIDPRQSGVSDKTPSSQIRKPSAFGTIIIEKSTLIHFVVRGISANLLNPAGTGWMRTILQKILWHFHGSTD